MPLFERDRGMFSHCLLQEMDVFWIQSYLSHWLGDHLDELRTQSTLLILTIAYVEVTALICRINKNNKTYQLSGPSQHPTSRQKIEWVVTQYWTCNTWNMTEASQCIYTLIFPHTGPATNHCQGNGLGHFQIVERPYVFIISLQLIIHYYAC